MGDPFKELSEQEADLYDRQIRLWGLESQTKLRAANVLLIGVRALGSEVAKDILLSGVNSLTIMDDGVVEKEDLVSNFLLYRDSLGKNIAESVLDKAKALNPMVRVIADTATIRSKNETFFHDFTIIVATRCTSDDLIYINQICRTSETQFICGDVFGMFGYMFSDLQIHEYYEDVPTFAPIKKRKQPGASQKSEQIIKRVSGTSTFVPLQDALGVDWSKDDQKKINGLSSLYFLFRVVQTFRDTYKRNLSFDEQETDIKKLLEIRDKLFNSLGVSSDKLSDSAFDIVFGEVAPVCAVVGGVIAQEVIKAVSHKEVPINNMFFFDPDNYSGKCECIGN